MKALRNKSAQDPTSDQLIDEARCVQITAVIKWIQKGQKCTESVPNKEKRRCQTNIIKKLKKVIASTPKKSYKR